MDFNLSPEEEAFRAEVRAFLDETRSGLTNELYGSFCERGRLAALRECEFVADVAHHDAYVVGL